MAAKTSADNRDMDAEVAEETGERGERGGSGHHGAPRPPRRFRRCRNPREVRRELVNILKAIWNGDLTPNEANAMINGCRVILQAITESDVEERLSALEQAAERAAEVAGAGVRQ